MKIKLQLTVEYDGVVVRFRNLAANLSWIVLNAVDNGCLTEGTEALVDSYVYTIEEVKE
jgi:hypothetical protein